MFPVARISNVIHECYLARLDPIPLKQMSIYPVPSCRSLNVYALRGLLGYACLGYARRNRESNGLFLVITKARYAARTRRQMLLK